MRSNFPIAKKGKSLPRGPRLPLQSLVVRKKQRCKLWAVKRLEKCRWEIFKRRERGLNIFGHVSVRFSDLFSHLFRGSRGKLQENSEKKCWKNCPESQNAWIQDIWQWERQTLPRTLGRHSPRDLAPTFHAGCFSKKSTAAAFSSLSGSETSVCRGVKTAAGQFLPSTRVF